MKRRNNKNGKNTFHLWFHRESNRKPWQLVNIHLGNSIQQPISVCYTNCSYETTEETEFIETEIIHNESVNKAEDTRNSTQATTIIKQQTNVVQYGEENVHINSAKHLIINNDSDKYFSYMIDQDLDEFFVETNIYKQVTTSLEEKNVVILIGQPGVGKTITSKKVANDYALRGFKILYSEEGNISNVTNILNEINSQEKTLIVLNDFLGQFYTYMKLDEKSEINSLLTSIKQYKNLKILINTRGIIYQEAMQCEKFNTAIENNSKIISEIQIKELDFYEKALILFNHLKRSYKNGFLSNEHYLDILKNRVYGDIILHKNFNPRIIEHITRKKFLTKTMPSEYVNQIFYTLENPATIWREEYEELNELDRICLNTLFSLTNTNVPIEVLKECFDVRQKKLCKDSTINHFEKSVNRLTDSLVSVILCNGKQRIGIINPSLNDFLYTNLMNNQNEIDEIFENSLYYEQIDKLISCKLKKSKLIEQINSGLLNRLDTFPKQIFSGFESYFKSSYYFHILKILLIYLDESELVLCGISKNTIEKYITNIFKNQYNQIEADARLYLANQLPDIFVKLLKNINHYDLTEIMTTEKYLNVILNSIARHDDFWSLLSCIQKNYFSCDSQKFYTSKNVESCIIDRITSEVAMDTYDAVLAEISSEINENYDDFADYDDVTDEVLNNIGYSIYDLISDSISTKLDKHNINSINEDAFDIDTLINDEINITEMIENEYDRIMYSQSDDFKENVEKSVTNVITLFENASWHTYANNA